MSWTLISAEVPLLVSLLHFLQINPAKRKHDRKRFMHHLVYVKQNLNSGIMVPWKGGPHWVQHSSSSHFLLTHMCIYFPEGRKPELQGTAWASLVTVSSIHARCGHGNGQNNLGSGNMDMESRGSWAVCGHPVTHWQATGWEKQICYRAWEGIWRYGKHGDMGTGSCAKSKVRKTRGEIWQNWWE